MLLLLLLLLLPLLLPLLHCHHCCCSLVAAVMAAVVVVVMSAVLEDGWTGVVGAAVGARRVRGAAAPGAQGVVHCPLALLRTVPSRRHSFAGLGCSWCLGSGLSGEKKSPFLSFSLIAD